MEKTIEVKYYDLDQNNSGGYLMYDEYAGIGAHVIIEATSEEQATALAGDIVSDYSAYCECCGDRWSLGYWSYSTYDTVQDAVGGMYDYEGADEKHTTFVHYLDGSIEGFGKKVVDTDEGDE